MCKYSEVTPNEKAQQIIFSLLLWVCFIRPDSSSSYLLSFGDSGCSSLQLVGFRRFVNSFIDSRSEGKLVFWRGFHIGKRENGGWRKLEVLENARNGRRLSGRKSWIHSNSTTYEQPHHGTQRFHTNSAVYSCYVVVINVFLFFC